MIFHQVVEMAQNPGFVQINLTLPLHRQIVAICRFLLKYPHILIFTVGNVEVGGFFIIKQILDFLGFIDSLMRS